MTTGDTDLLARLNALKPSSVSLTSAPKSSVDVEVSRPQTVEDKLADRLKALRANNGHRPVVLTDGTPGDKSDALTAHVDDEIATESDPIRDWQHNEGDEQTLEDLLDELGPDDQWTLDYNDPKYIASLLKDAKMALPVQGEQDTKDGAGHEDGEQAERLDAGREDETEGSVGKTEDQQDEEEADDYVQKVLAELDVEEQHEPKEEQRLVSPKEEGEQADSSNVGLPSTPSNLQSPLSTTEPPTYEDSELEARFSKLGLDLPSTPTAPPSAKPKVIPSMGGKQTKSKLPTYTDEDIDSWCCICNEDGEVRCLGCDADIYCQDCWQDGHGNGPGQERGHRAVQYVKKSGDGFAAA